MITVRDFMETVDYRITEGSDFCWNCFGYNAYRLDSWNGEQEGHNISIVFDTATQVVYQAEAHDYKSGRSYRLINPQYKAAHDTESKEKGVDSSIAWDDVKFIDLEDDGDWLEKAGAIFDGVDYDTRVQLPLDLDDNLLLQLALEAHKRDITMNQMVEVLLRNAIVENKSSLQW